MPIRAVPAHKQTNKPPVTLAECIRKDTKGAEAKLFNALYHLNKRRYQMKEAGHDGG